MIQVPTIKDVFATYSHNPEALKACREVMSIVESSINEILTKSKAVKAVRSVATKATVKEPIQPLTPLQQLISQAPAELREDLYNVFPAMLDLAGSIMINTVTDKPESKEGTQGECLDYLVAPHIEVLQDKHADCIPTVNHYLYQLAAHCLFTASNIAGKVIKP